jgi:hypothetical protein
LDRARVAIVFASIIIGGAGYAGNMIWVQYGGNYVVFVLYAGLSVVIVPLAVTYAIVRHRVFDVAFVLNRTLVYAITSTLVLVALAALEFAAEQYIASLTRVEGIAVEFGIALIIIVSARMVHARVDRAVDNVLFRDRHQQESSLRRFSTTLQFYTEQPPLLRDTVDALVRFGRVQGAAIYLPDGKRVACAASAYPVAAPAIDENDPAYVELRAHHEQLQIHDVSTSFLGDRLYPMFLAGRLVGIVSTGERESGEQMPLGAVQRRLGFRFRRWRPSTSGLRTPLCGPGWPRYSWANASERCNCRCCGSGGACVATFAPCSILIRRQRTMKSATRRCSSCESSAGSRSLRMRTKQPLSEPSTQLLRRQLN